MAPHSGHQRDVVEFARAVDHALAAHRGGDGRSSELLIAMLEDVTDRAVLGAGLKPLHAVGDLVAFDASVHDGEDVYTPGEDVFVAARGFAAVNDPLLTRLFPERPVAAKATVRRGSPFALPASDVSSLLDERVPQPGREREYGVPAWVVGVLGLLYSLRAEIADGHVGRLDEAILTLLRPWFRSREEDQWLRHQASGVPDSRR